MAEQQNDRSFVSGLVATGKDLIAMLRDAMLLLIAVLLLAWPQTINSILVAAGFEEGSFAGVKWKAKLTQSDDTLLKAQSTIADLTDQNSKLSAALSDLKAQVTGTETKAKIGKLEQLNTQLAANSARVQAAVETTTSANAPLVQKLQTSAGTVVTWGVVFGGDTALADAKHEIQTIAPKLGLTNAAIYYRQGSYRSVATTADRLQAEQLLLKAKERRKDSYIVNMSTWCRDAAEKNGYFECGSS
jgi:hypothetical protein